MSTGIPATLENYNSATLTLMAAFQGISPKGSKTKAVHIRHLSELFRDPKHIHAAFEGLSPAEREILNTLLRNQGRASRQEIERGLYARKLIDRPRDDKRRAYNYQPNFRFQKSRQLDEIMARLLTLGLVFAVYESSSRGGSGALLDFNLENEYFIPDEIRSYLPEPPPAEPLPTLKNVSVERVKESSARAFQRDIFLYWSYLQENRVSLLQSGNLSKRDLVALNETLLVREEIGPGQKESDFERLVFLRSLMRELGLLRLERNGDLLALPNPAFLTQDPAERLRRCFEIYVTGNLINELSWYPNLRLGASSTPRLPTPSLVADARRVLLLHLRNVPGWVSIQNFTERIRDLDFEFLFKRDFRHPYYAYSYAYSRNPYSSYGNPLEWEFSDVSSDEIGWMKVEGGFIRDVLQAPLFWMGLVDLGFTQETLREPDAFRLTPVGAWLLGAGPQPEIPVEGGQVIVQPNFQIMAFDPVSDGVLMNLSRFAERISAERVAEFRMTRASLYNAQKQGWDAARVCAYLESLTGVPMPENVKKTLEEWQALHERITLHPNLSLIHAAQSGDIDDLLADPELSKRLGRRYAPNLIQLRQPRALAQTVRSLLERERLPLISFHGGSLPPRSVALSGDGSRISLRFTLPTPDLYLHGHLARFADQDGDGYRLTPASVRRAANSGLKAPRILEELSLVLTEPLPDPVAQKILAWAGHYGDASLEEVILIQLEKASTLGELLEDPEVGPLLQPFKPRSLHSLARVRPKDLLRLRELLEARGIRLKER